MSIEEQILCPRINFALPGVIFFLSPAKIHVDDSKFLITEVAEVAHDALISLQICFCFGACDDVSELASLLERL